jgi:hypothetical protein
MVIAALLAFLLLVVIAACIDGLFHIHKIAARARRIKAFREARLKHEGL